MTNSYLVKSVLNSLHACRKWRMLLFRMEWMRNGRVWRPTFFFLLFLQGECEKWFGWLISEVETHKFFTSWPTIIIDALLRKYIYIMPWAFLKWVLYLFIYTKWHTWSLIVIFDASAMSEQRLTQSKRQGRFDSIIRSRAKQSTGVPTNLFIDSKSQNT